MPDTKAQGIHHALPPLAADLAVAFAQAEQRLTREYGPEYKTLKPLLQGMACWPR